MSALVSNATKAVAVLYSDPIFSDSVPYRSLGQNLDIVPIPIQYFQKDIDPIQFRSDPGLDLFDPPYIPLFYILLWQKIQNWHLTQKYKTLPILYLKFANMCLTV